jgi:hypothetical protein
MIGPAHGAKELLSSIFSDDQTEMSFRSIFNHVGLREPYFKASRRPASDDKSPAAFDELNCDGEVLCLFSQSR